MNIDIMERTEVYAVGAFAVVAAFALNAKTEGVALESSIIALTVAIIGALRYRALARTITIHDRYIEAVIEEKYTELGWERYYRTERDKLRKGALVRLRTARWLLWYALILAAVALIVVVAVWGPFGAADEMIVKRYDI